MTRCLTADILVYINDTCVLGRSHKEVVEMLKSVPMGQSVDVVLRRGYPMLYNPDGCPKQSLEVGSWLSVLLIVSCSQLFQYRHILFSSMQH